MVKQRKSVVLSALIREHGWLDGVEVGVFRGQNMAALLADNPELAMVGVDTWQAGDPALDPAPGTQRTAADTGYCSYADVDMREVMAEAYGVASFFGRGRCTLIQAPSVVAADAFPAMSVDFVFLDASHVEEDVEADIRAWLPAIKRTGWLLGHDRDYPSVKRVIDRLVPGYRSFNANIWGLPVEEIRLG